MKKLFLSLLAVAAAAIVVQAESELIVVEDGPLTMVELTVTPELQSVAPIFGDFPVSYFQAGIWPGFPASMNQSQVYGIKSGWPMCGGEGVVNGMEVSWTGSLTDYIRGIQASWLLCENNEFMGLQAALGTCLNQDCFEGAQGALVFTMAGDFKGLQASALNISGDGVGFQPAAILNCSGDLRGVQLAVITNAAEDVNGVQASLINNAWAVCGMQLGLLNFADSGFQFGLINVMEDGVLPFFPIVNFSL